MCWIWIVFHQCGAILSALYADLSLDFLDSGIMGEYKDDRILIRRKKLDSRPCYVKKKKNNTLMNDLQS